MEFNATIIVSAVSFIVFIFVMNSILYQPILKIIEERTNFINSHIEEANNFKNKAQAILEDKNLKIKDAHKVAKNTISDGIEASAKNKTNEVNSAIKRTKEQIETEKNQLLQAEQEAKDALKLNVSDLAKDISEKLLGQQVPHIEIDQQLVDEAMNNA